MNRKIWYSFGILFGISFVLFIGQFALSGAQTANFEAKLVEGAVTIDGKGDEAFWEEVDFQKFTLTATPGSPAGVPTVEMKAVYTATEIRILAIWADATKNNNKSEGDEDRIALMLAMGANPMESPCMNTSTNGATTSGTADQWHWKAARTDSDGYDHDAVSRRNILYNPSDETQVRGGITVLKNEAVFTALAYGDDWNITGIGEIGDTVYVKDGVPTVMETVGSTKLVVTTHANSFADNEFMNTTGRYRAGESEYTKFGLDESPFGDQNRHFIKAKGYHNGTHWSVEYVRDLDVINSENDLAIAPGDTVKFAVAVYEGTIENDHEFKTITTAWKTLMIVEEPMDDSSAIPGFPMEWVVLASSITLIGVVAIIKKRKN